jgi:hypothetical protein
MQRVGDVQTVWCTGWNWGMAWEGGWWGGGGMGLRGEIVYCGLVGILDFCFPVLFFYNHFS